jgi:hypothetical protein
VRCVDPITGLPMKPTARAVLNRLRKGPATTHELCQPEVGGIRFGGRIEELRNDEGFIISREYLRPGSHLYRLLAEPSPRDRGVAVARDLAKVGAAVQSRPVASTTSPALTPPAGDKPASRPPAARAESSKMPRSSGEVRATSVSAALDPCEAMVAPAARDLSTSAHDAQMCLLDELAA